MGGIFDPWGYAATRHPGVSIDPHADLPSGLLGLTNGVTIWLSRRLTQAARRCTLMHELIHIERGPAPTIAWMAHKEHRRIDTETARTLIQLDDYIDALRWTSHETELADELWVDVPTLRDYTRSLSDAERRHITATLDQAA